MSALGEGVQAPPDKPSKQFETTQQERELLVKLRLLDFWRFNRGRKAIVEWNGARLIVFDAQQVS